MNEWEKNHKKLLDDIDKKKRTSPLKAIRAFCLECVGYNAAEVEKCSANQDEQTRCPLFTFRFGKNKSGIRSGHNVGLKVSNSHTEKS